MIDSERFAKATLAQLGHERCSSGDWIHQLLSAIYYMLPEEIALQFWSRMLSPKKNVKKSGKSEEFSIKKYISDLTKMTKKTK